jgi:putative GTP pyrophosphokinase
MATELSKTQVDRLGDRLRKGNITEADLRLLDQYRRSFTEAYEVVVEAIRNDLGLEPTGRPAKSTTSISDKLRRESIRLSQIQDIAGCRLIVPDIATQEPVVQSLTGLFEHTTVSDRREKPSHGYRAVHVVVTSQVKLIEIQVRTELQQLWAELSEKCSDVIEPAVKYGGGSELVKTLLSTTSSLVEQHELIETEVASTVTKFPLQDRLAFEAKFVVLRQNVFKYLKGIIELLEGVKGEGDDISD